MQREMLSVLRYWQDLEFFRPEPVPMPKGSENDISLLAYSDAELPWKQETEGNIHYGIWLTLFDFQEIVDELSSLFGKDEMADTVVKEIAALCWFAVDNKGIPLPGSFSVSTAGWAIAKLRKEDPDFEAFSQDARALTKRFDRRSLFRAESKRPLLFADLERVEKWYLDSLGGFIPKTKHSALACITKIRIPIEKKGKKRVKSGMLNSFYLPDLEMVASAVACKKGGEAFRRYLSPSSPKKRIDLRQSPSLLESLTSKKNLPLGRWPAPDDHRLSLMQQAAVNLSLQKGDETSLFSINGPPGTGKTTLLKEIIAEKIIERARALATFSDPKEAFAPLEGYVWSRTDRFSIHLLHERLREFGIVLASTNNHAVENVTKSIPDLTAIAPEWHHELDYFKEIATRLLNEGSSETRKAWGLIAAPLGRVENRIRFVQQVWRNDEEEEELTIKKRLINCHTNHSAPDWNEAKEAFLSLEQETSSPCDAIRTTLFIRAMALHRAFIENSMPYIFNPLELVMRLLEGHGHFAHEGPTTSLSREELTSVLFSYLFLLVPVISTTFASASFLFEGIGADSLPLLLIDEAGQTLPQAAAGLIFRSKRCIALGDSLQLEPIFTLPEKACLYLREHRKVSRHFCPLFGSSAQILADHANPYGTFLPPTLSGHHARWIGSPLIDHRRCEEPMFSLSNTIAYGNMMEHNTPSKPSPIGALLGPSSWLTIKSEENYPTLWIPEEGEATVDLLTTLEALEHPDVFVISPFRLVIHNLHILYRRSFADAKRIRELTRRTGTIHAFQGKEAEAVILVLGCQEAHLSSAKWAGRRPNLLNVALTRAKQRLYVIGNIDVWKQVPFFSHVTSTLPIIQKSTCYTT